MLGRPAGGCAHRRVSYALALASAPIIWALTDLAVTGDPLHSLHATSELADDLNRERGLDEVPGSFVSFVCNTARPPVALLAPVGAVLAVLTLGWQRDPRSAGAVRGRRDHVRRHRRARALDPAALPDGPGDRGVPVRRLRAARASPSSRTRGAGWWARASAAAAVVGAIGLIMLAPSLTNVREEVRFIRATHDSLIATLDDPAVRAGMRCGTLTMPTYRLVPDARWHLEGASIGSRSTFRRPRGVEVFALGQKALRRYGLAAGTSPRVNLPSPGYEPVARHGLLAAYRKC